MDMREFHKFFEGDTFRWLSTKNVTESFVVVASVWSINKGDWLYTVRYLTALGQTTDKFRRYTERHMARNAVFTGKYAGDALKGAPESELAALKSQDTVNASEPLQSQPSALGGHTDSISQDNLARVTEFNPFEAEPNKKLARVYDIMLACISRFGTDSAEYKNRLAWYLIKRDKHENQ
jgi:hypothetical protein